MSLFGVGASAQDASPAQPAGAADAKQSEEAADAGTAPSEPAPEGTEAAEPEQEPATQGATPAPPEGVEEITVIGEVLETSTQAEAEAITTFDQAELDTLGITDVDTLALNTPSLHVGQVGQQAVITLRGVGLENLTSIGEGGVGFQVDGVHLARPAAANAAFFDVERVDVLRGPQGTDGGRNLNGGRIAVWSAKPTEELEAKGDATYGNYQTYESRAVLNVPVWSDKLMTRVSAIFARRNGYQDNDMYAVSNKNTGDAKDYTVRPQIRSVLFDEQVELRGIAVHGKQSGRGPDLKLIGAAPSTIQLASVPVYSALWPGSHDGQLFSESPYYAPPGCPPQPYKYTADYICTPKDARDSFMDFVSDRDNHQNGLTGIGTWNLPIFQDTPFSDLRLGTIASWQQIGEDWVYDFDGTNIPDQILDLTRNAHQYSLEAYIERPDVGRWDFKAGFYALDEDIHTHVCFDIRGPVAGPGLSDFAYKGQVGTRSIAGYGQAGFRITENLRAYGGIRWTNDEKSLDEGFWNVQPLDSINNPLNDPHACGNQTRSLVGLGQYLSPNPPRNTNTENYSGWTPKGAFEWQITDTATLGLSVTRGFKSGGFPTVVSPDIRTLDQAYDSEFTWEYALTSKNELWDGRIRLNTTAFWVEYDPFQVCQFNGPAYLCDSNGSATIRGVEFEWLMTPIEGLQLNGFFNWLDSRINNMQVIDPTIRQCVGFTNDPPCPSVGTPPRDPQAQVPVDVSGNSLTRSPQWAGSFGIQYEFDLGRWGFFTPRFATQFQGLTYYRVFNSYDNTKKQPGYYYLTSDKQEPFIKYDAKIMWRSENDRFTAEIFGVNLSDEDVINSVVAGSAFSGGQAFAQYQPPRTYGIRFGINYISDWLPDMF